MTELVQDILRLKKERNAIILAHVYQNAEIQAIADYTGDSLELAKRAAELQIFYRRKRLCYCRRRVPAVQWLIWLM